MQTLLKHSYEKITSRFDGGGTCSILMLHVCASKCWFINTSALAGALREHNADEEDRVICIIIIINNYVVECADGKYCCGGNGSL